MINVFTRQNCTQCKRTKDLMKAKGIEFNVVDITDDEKMAESLKKQGYRQLPVVATETETWSGFNPQKIAEVAKNGTTTNSTQS